MGHFVYFFKTLNIARSQGSLPESKNNTLRTVSRLSLDLLFFRDTSSTSSVINSNFSKWLLSFYAEKIPQFFFYEEPEDINLVKYYSSLYRHNDPKPILEMLVPENTFIDIKIYYDLFVNEDLSNVLDYFNLFNDEDNSFLIMSFFANFFKSDAFDKFFFCSYNLNYPANLDNPDLLILFISEYLNGSIHRDFNIIWNGLEDNIQIGWCILNMDEKFEFIKVATNYDFGDLDLKKVTITKPFLPNRALRIGFKSIEPTKNYQVINFSESKKLVAILKKIVFTKIEIKQSIFYLAIRPYFTRHIVFVSFVSSPLAAKSYTMRSRQFYRSGVLFCLSLTLITIITPYYLFYGLAFIFSYWWVITSLLFARYLILFLWKITPFKYKLKINNYINIL